MANRYDMTVQWGDCDPAAIVFYPNYFRWFENGTTELFASVGLELPQMFVDYGILGIPILDAHAKFTRPSRFRDVITVESAIESWGNSSFKVRHTIFNGGVEAVPGHEVRAWVVTDPSHANGIRAQRVPDDIRARFA
ncbi:MAG TPA: thioesterase family protein [Magnetovibrio sp.]